MISQNERDDKKSKTANNQCNLRVEHNLSGKIVILKSLNRKNFTHFIISNIIKVLSFVALSTITDKTAKSAVIPTIRVTTDG